MQQPKVWALFVGDEDLVKWICLSDDLQEIERWEKRITDHHADWHYEIFGHETGISDGTLVQFGKMKDAGVVFIGRQARALGIATDLEDVL